ncbi:hypothetical protein GCM10015536_26590 [Streptomyces griseomycini]|nr:hypothetical protein GCM10015536_26590 [Streptomyces griseomycini]
MTSSGRMQDSSIPTPSRTLRYSGSERPACRMNHTGVCGTGSRLHAFRKALSYVAVGCIPAVGLTLALTPASLARSAGAPRTAGHPVHRARGTRSGHRGAARVSLPAPGARSA